MREAGEILQSYMGLLARLTGASSVSVYVPPAVNGAREILVHEGAVGPLPELGDADKAAELHRRFGAEETAGKGYLARCDAQGLLYRIPLRWATSRGDEQTSSTERRKRDGITRERPGRLRFERRRRPEPRSGRGRLPTLPRYATKLLRDFALAAASRITRAASRGSCSTRSPSCRG